MTAQQRPALTRIELLLVIILMATAMGVFLPACVRVRDGDGARMQSLCNLKQVSLSLHDCNDTYRRLPPAWGEFPPRTSALQAQTSSRGTVHFWLLPFCEADNVFRLGVEPAAPNAKTWSGVALRSNVVPPYVSPMDFTNADGTVTLNGAVYGVQNYAANIRVFGPLSGTGAQPGVDPAAEAFDGGAQIPKSFPDGRSNTIVFATRYGQCGSGASTWSQIGSATLGPFAGNSAFFGSNISPTLNGSGDNTSGDNTTFQAGPTQPGGANPCNPIYAQSFGTGGIQIALADGSVRTVSPNISIRTWSRAVIPNDGFTLDSDW